MFNKIKCFLNTHDLYVIQEFKGYRARRVGCGNCPKQWGMNDDTQSFIPWDKELEEMYESFGF